MQIGKIQFLDEGKGFGFIWRKGAPDVFFEVAAVQGGPLKVGQRVMFEIDPQRTRGREEARLIRPLQAAYGFRLG